ncbi:hypothetical protein MKX08_003785 [Trichoderma sp. CBMAI-0020]|nr:hypothetical protein MKX08_003785 [Trichoderma sp. CBMAI-0020]
MPQDLPMPLYLILAPFIASIHIVGVIFHILMSLDHWILALIVHHEIAWIICLMTIAIGEAIQAPWRLQLDDTYNGMGDKAFAAAFLAIFSLWTYILSFFIICEFAAFLVWGCVYFVAVWTGARPPRLLPLIERIWLAAGYDLMAIWVTHYE